MLHYVGRRTIQEMLGSRQKMKHSGYMLWMNMIAAPFVRRLIGGRQTMNQ